MQIAHLGKNLKHMDTGKCNVQSIMKCLFFTIQEAFTKDILSDVMERSYTH